MKNLNLPKGPRENWKINPIRNTPAFSKCSNLYPTFPEQPGECITHVPTRIALLGAQIESSRLNAALPLAGRKLENPAIKCTFATLEPLSGGVIDYDDTGDVWATIGLSFVACNYSENLPNCISFLCSFHQHFDVTLQLSKVFQLFISNGQLRWKLASSFSLCIHENVVFIVQSWW